MAVVSPSVAWYQCARCTAAGDFGSSQLREGVDLLSLHRLLDDAVDGAAVGVAHLVGNLLIGAASQDEFHCPGSPADSERFAVVAAFNPRDIQSTHCGLRIPVDFVISHEVMGEAVEGSHHSTPGGVPFFFDQTIRQDSYSVR